MSNTTPTTNTQNYTAKNAMLHALTFLRNIVGAIALSVAVTTFVLMSLALVIALSGDRDLNVSTWALITTISGICSFIGLSALFYILKKK